MPEGLNRVLHNMDAWHLRMRAATLTLAQNLAGRMEAYAKRNAPWTDRTGNARNGLWGAAGTDGREVWIRVGHTVEYGKWLELAHDGKYAILGPTITAHTAQVQKAFEELWQK